MRNMLLALAGAAALLAGAGAAHAHGITVVLERHGDFVVATARYDGGTPVRDAEVVIRAPGDEAPFQRGRTDGAGRFAFWPAGAGEWRVTVDDGTGHRRTARLEVEAPAPPEASPADSPAVAGGCSLGLLEGPDEEDGAPAVAGVMTVTAGVDARGWRLVTGLSLLFGLTGVGYGYTARARRRTDGDAGGR
jgi:hypothetical protein